jgi:hypothetical protein
VRECGIERVYLRQNGGAWLPVLEVSPERPGSLASGPTRAASIKIRPLRRHSRGEEEALVSGAYVSYTRISVHDRLAH